MLRSPESWNFAKSACFWPCVAYLGSVSLVRSSPFTFVSMRREEFSEKLSFSSCPRLGANLLPLYFVLYFIKVLIPSLHHCEPCHFPPEAAYSLVFNSSF